MSLKPIRSSRRLKKRAGAYRSFHSRQQWKPWKGWTGPVIKKNILGLFGKKLFILLLIGLAVTVGFAAMYADPNNSLFHNIQPNPNYCVKTTFEQAHNLACGDPQTTLWDEQANSGTFISDFGSTPGAHSAQGYLGNWGWVLTPNGTDSAIALTKTSIDFSTVSGKELATFFAWNLISGSIVQSSCGLLSCPREWGWYLTRSGVLPSSTGYSPQDDANVALVFQNSNQTSGTKFYSRLLIQRDAASTTGAGLGNCFSVGTCFVDTAFTTIQSVYNSADMVLNFTGNAGTGGNNGVSNIYNGVAAYTSTTFPWFHFEGISYYIGFYARYGNPTSQSVIWYADAMPSCGGFMCAINYIPTPPNTISPPSPTIDTGGFFGPVIRALINIGVFILNALLTFVSYVAPALIAAVNFLETIVVTILNTIGNLLGFGNIGTDLQTLLNAIIAFFTNTSYGLPAFILQFPSYFTNFLSWLQIVFPFLGPSFTIANGILAFGVNGILFGITVLSYATGLLLFGYAMVAIFGFFIFTGDDAVGGLLTYLGTMEALAFKMLNLIAVIFNLGIDIIVHVISIIPKPIIQMGAAEFPRLPTITTGASITMPRMDFAELRNGNLLSVWLWTMGLWFDTWYESHNPVLPGSIAALVPATATNMQLLSTLLPLFQVFVFIAGGTTLFWVVMRPLHLLGADLGVFESIGIGTGGHQAGTGPGGIGVHAGEKHLIGRIRERAERGKNGGLGSQVGKGEFGPQNRSAEEQATA